MLAVVPAASGAAADATCSLSVILFFGPCWDTYLHICGPQDSNSFVLRIELESDESCSRTASCTCSGFTSLNSLSLWQTFFFFDWPRDRVEPLFISPRLV